MENRFTVVEGRKSEYYNHFADYSFASCEATDTRLMGVVVLHVVWTSDDSRSAKLHQVMHLDFSEYGIDEYREFELVPGSDDYRDKKSEMNALWNKMKRVSGGKTVSVPLSAMISLIDSALPLASEDIDREYDDSENVSFRKNALLRISLMKEALAERADLVTERTYSENEIIEMVSPSRLATHEVINYFIMRLVDLDYPAAQYLSHMSRSELENLEITDAGIQTLVRNVITDGDKGTDIAPDGISVPYRCNVTTLGRTDYLYSTLVLWLDGNARKKDRRVTAVSVGSISRLSDYEAAMQISSHEYITVFDCRDRILNGFDGSKIAPLSDIDPQFVPNGWLYTIYNKDNSHVDSTDYRLSDDVYGYALLTIDGEFILMSNKLINISMLDNATILSFYAPYMTLSGRYQLDTPIFHTLCYTHGVMFDQLIEHDDDGE